jgi:hypothetical protein
LTPIGCITDYRLPFLHFFTSSLLHLFTLYTSTDTHKDKWHRQHKFPQQLPGMKKYPEELQKLWMQSLNRKAIKQ